MRRLILSLHAVIIPHNHNILGDGLILQFRCRWEIKPSLHFMQKYILS